jgi:ketosteroid isomerase-like protein
MRTRLARLVGAIAIGTSLLAPTLAGAAELTLAQKQAVSAATTKYVKAVVAGDATTLKTLVSPKFVVVRKDGTKLSGPDAFKELAVLKQGTTVNANQSNVTVSDIALAGDNVTANASVFLNGTTTTAEGGSVKAVNLSKHKLTWAKDPATSKWLLIEDDITSSQTTKAM